MDVSGLRISWAMPAASVPERGELLLLFEQDFALHQLRAQRRNQVAVEDNAEHSDEREQQNDADEKKDAQVGERAVRISRGKDASASRCASASWMPS